MRRLIRVSLPDSEYGTSSTAAYPVGCLGMAPKERIAIDPVRPCLVQSSMKWAMRCPPIPALGWDRESETGIVPKYRRGQHNPAGMGRAVTSIGFLQDSADW